MEGGRRTSIIIVLGMGCSESHILMKRKEEKEGPSQAIFPIPAS
jgi:hypothetical protein